MAFIGSSYGMHDATWRTNFGGNIYQSGGSHGCVNMPYESAARLYEIIEPGTPVLIY
jgi:lipoprotein-anchoring transpeptidase ErfK/SrfK